MKLSDTVIVACVTLLPVALAADYSAGCSDKNMGESMCDASDDATKACGETFNAREDALQFLSPSARHEFTWMADPPVNLTVATNITLPANSTVATNVTVPANLTVVNNSTELTGQLNILRCDGHWRALAMSPAAN
ncbi:hypothetical protein HBH51_050550 [Parastagonospora nodorum]|nr:hypothetical protein HBH51_050550 [Parastagonospora nodorum]